MWNARKSISTAHWKWCFQYVTRRRREKKWNSAVIWRQKLCNNDLQLWSSWQSNKTLRPARPQGEDTNMTRVNRRKLETKCWLKAYESMQRDTSKRILQGKPLAAEGSLPEGHTSFGGNCTRETVLMSTVRATWEVWSRKKPQLARRKNRWDLRGKGPGRFKSRRWRAYVEALVQPDPGFWVQTNFDPKGRRTN